jgi:sentrin-specific protease 8
MSLKNQKLKYEDTDLILNYHDAVIYGSDLKLVQSRTDWLNDACIHFFFNLLQHAENTRQSVFMDPSVLSYFMHQCTDEEDIEDFVSNTRFPATGKVFIPVNDNMALSSGWQLPKSGNHWSLLMVMISPRIVQFCHFDSVRSSGNYRAAQDIVDKLGRYVFRQSTNADLVQASTPQQDNGYDCGIHVLAAAQVFSSIIDTELVTHEAKLRTHVQESTDFCFELRNYISSEILRIADETKS